MIEKNQRRKKIWLRVASVIMALLLWFYVVNQGDVSTGRNLLDVELKYYNPPADLTVTGPEKVSVKLWGSSHGSGNIVAYVDLAGLGKGVHQVPVKLEPVKGAMLTTVQPNKVDITLEELSEKVFQVKYEVKQNPQAGYQLTEVLLAIDSCLVKGEADAVGRVARVVAPIDLGNIKDITSVKVNLQARDANGKTVSAGIKLVPATIDAYIVLEKKQSSKNLSVKPQFSGIIAEGFSLGEVKSDPAQITVLGDQLRVEALNEIVTKPIDIGGKQESFVQVVELVQPEGITVSPNQITINVKINKIVVKGVQ
jgi:YbbR domain-containing protein